MSDNAFPDALPAQYRLHWYVLERVLGQGGFGITYLARDTNLDQPVAIKEYLPVEVATRRADSTVAARTEEQQERYRWGLERFIREARTLARFDHSNIVRVLSVFELNSTAYMVMRFEEGETLAALLDRRQALGEADLLRVLLPILDGLELVHNAGFIHRDIKPDNIHIRDDGTPVLLDFGSARYAVGQMRTVTILVAPGYAPFEQYYSTGENQGPWTDIYGLGATCYRAIAGRAPLDAIARSKGILGSTQELLVPATAVGSGRYSERLLKAIDHALAFAEKDRPQTIAAWRAELVADAPTTARTAVLTRSVPAADVPARPAPPRPSWVSARAPLFWGGAGAVAALVAIILVPWLASGRREQAVTVVPNPPATEAPAPKVSPQVDDNKIKELIAQQLEEQRKKEAQREDEQRKQDAEKDQQRRAEARKKKGPKEIEKPIARAEPKGEPIVPKTQPNPTPAIPAEPKPERSPETPPLAKADPPPPPVAKPPSPREQLSNAEAAIERSDYGEAVRILRPLADQGNARAQVRLGDLYLEGQGVPQSDKEALSLYVKAGQSGDTEGQVRAGDMYVEGRGARQNNLLAYAFYSAAACAGLAIAKLRLDRVAGMLQPAEKAQAGKLVEDLAKRKGC